MSTFYSARSGHSVQLRPGGYGEVVDPVMGKMRVPIKPMVVHFRALDKKIPVFGLPSKNGIAGGILDPRDGAAQIRRKATELGPSADNLPATDEELTKWLTKTLRENPACGSEYVEVPDADEVLPGESFENLKTGALGEDPVGVIVRTGGKNTFCRVCQKSVDPRGVNGHRKSNKHLAALKAYEDQLREDSKV